MTPERWERLQELFAMALELTERDRSGFVRGLGPDDDDLREELAKMLAAHDPTTDWPSPGAKEPDVDPLIGMQLGDYRLDDEIGRGAGGLVYRATQMSKQRVVAVKVLRRDIIGSQAGLERFKREALAASRLKHPGLVRVHYFGRDEGFDYLVMDHVDGPNLREHLVACRELPPGEPPKQGPDLRDPRACAALVRDVARGLQAAHDARVLHRDVKPRNIILDADGAPHLADFGLAKDQDLADLTRTGEISGTPQYMSPEQARAVRERIDHRTDVYSLGAVLYELLAGRAPVEGDSTAEVIHNILHRPVAPLYRGHEEVPRRLALVCMRALRRKPSRRYQSAKDFADDLDRFLEGDSVHATKQGIAERIEERVLDRRVLVKLVPAALALGVLGGLAIYSGIEVAHARGMRPRVEVFVDSGVEARVTYLPLGDQHEPAGDEVELGRTRDGRLDETVVPEGSARILVRADDGNWSEHWRTFHSGTRAVVHSRPRPVREQAEGMLSFGARVIDAPFDPRPSRGPEGIEHRGDPTTVGAFLIDEACVTNGDFRRYLESEGRRYLDHWNDTWKTIWDYPPREDWDELPVVNLTLEEARDYAEWVGKRLPTALEREIAAGAYEVPTWTASLTPDRLALTYVLGRPRLEPWEGEDQWSTGAAYLLHAQPVRSAERRCPTGLYDPVGNVGEWLETRAVMQLPEGEVAVQRVTGTGWSRELMSKDRRNWLFAVGAELGTKSPQDMGFRCARSLGL